MSKHLLLVDASGFCHRAFYSRAAKYRSDGLPIWAVVGFMDMVWNMLQRAKADNPTHGAAVFDAPGKNFRHKIFPAYKANRPAARREELTPQMPYMRHAAAALGLIPVEAAGWEADDVIATLATQAAAQGIRVTIISSDKDFCQLVRDGVVEIIEPIGKKRVTSAGVKARFGCAPDLVPDVQALWGDDVDGIPGIDGVGGKTAGALIHKAGGLEKLLAMVSRSGMALGTPAQRKAIRKGADDARLYKRLATLDIRVPNMPSIDSLALHKPEVAHLKEVLRVLEVGRLFDVMFGGDPGVTMRLPHVPAPLQWWHGAVKIAASNIAIRELPNDPQDGFFQRKLVKGGPWVPARIWRDAEKDFVTDQETGFDVVKCEVAGKPRHPLKEFDALGRYPITKEKFDHLMAVGNWAKTYAPNSSEANPTQPIDWNKEPL
jgi:DNA polymerase-1